MILAGCGGGGGGSTTTTTTPPAIGVSISPATVSLAAGGTQAFTATVSNDSANAGVTWSMGTGAGALSAKTTTGVTYSAPATIGSTTTVTVTATSVTDTTKSSSAIVTLTAPPIGVSISPATITLGGGGTQAFTAAVSNDSANAGVTWSIGTGAGALSAKSTTGVTYTAPATVGATATVTLTATSVTDTTKSGSATITLIPGAISSVSVSCNPASVSTWETSQCAATVAGTGGYNSAVTWSAGGVQGGNSTVGFVSTSGIYTAPNKVPSTNPVTVTATSVADTTKSGSASLTITAASGTPSITQLSETTANPFDALTITGTNFDLGTEAVSVIFTPESGDTAVMVPVSSSGATSIGVMVPTFTNSSGAYSAETVDVQVVLFSDTKTYLTNTIDGLQVATLPPVPSGIAPGTMTAALLSAATNTSTTVQTLGSGVSSLANVSASLSQLNADIAPIGTAATSIAGASSQTVNLTLANGTTTPLNASIMARSDQLAQAMLAAIVSQASIPTAGSTSACPAATGDTAFDNNLCNAQYYFQTFASQASPSAGLVCKAGMAEPDYTLTPPEQQGLTLFANLALGGIAEACEPAGGGLIYSMVGAPIVTSFISSLAVNQEMPSGTDVAQSVGLNALDAAAFGGLPVLGTSVDLYKALAALATYSPPVPGILLSTGIATFNGDGLTSLDPNNGTPTTLQRVPNAPAGGAFDSTTLVVSQSGLLILTLTTSGTGSGSIASFPTGTTFPSGTVILMAAVPSTGLTFAGWSGACSGTGACSVTMTSNKSVNAIFNKSTFDLTVGTAGSGSGSVAENTAGTSCGANCFSYLPGTAVELTANASSGSTFAGWSGACSGTGACSVTMNSNQSVTATFNQNLLDLTWGSAGTGSGAISVSPAGAICGSDCYSYNPGTQVELTATPGSNSTFAGWSGACSGTGACSVTMDSNMTATATFNASSGGSTPQAGTYLVTCSVTVGSFQCCADNQCSTFPGLSTFDTEPYTDASGTTISQLTSAVCSDWTSALASVGCTPSCSLSSTSTSFTLSGSCTVPEVSGCTDPSLTMSCTATLQ